MARILVVDDNKLARFTLRTMMEAMGHEVRDAADGEIALRVQAEFHADLVITDIIMPNMEGLETSVALLDKFPDVKIIAVSGGGRVAPESYLDLAQEMGVHAILKKPFESSDIEPLVENLLAQG